MKKNLIHGMLVLLFVLIVCASSAAAQNDIVTRDLPDTADAGTTITVNLSVDVETGATNYIIDETVPAGWTVTSSTGGGDYATQVGHVMWAITAGAIDIVHSYTVEVPADASGAYTFGDGCYYVFEGMTDTATILGDTTVNVGAGVVVDTVTRDLPDTADAGTTITVNLSVDVETGATNYIIDETVPAGWTVTSSTGGGDYATQVGHVMWAITAGAIDIVHSYTVEVPADASGAYTFGDGCYYVFEGMTDTAIILGDTTVNVGAPTPADIVINEIMYAPTNTWGGYTNEWIELYNNDTNAINITGWTIDGETISTDTVMQPGDYVIIARNDTKFAEYYPDASCTVIKVIISLLNSGETICLNDSSSSVIDCVDYTEYADLAKNNETLERNATGGWEASLVSGGTPCVANSVLVAANQPPTAVIASPTADGAYHAGTEVSFLSTGSSDPEGGSVSYNWDFGDGSTSPVANTTHTYATTGSKTVTLTVTDNEGAIDTANVTIIIRAANTRQVTLDYNSNNLGYNYIAWSGSDATASVLAGSIKSADAAAFGADEWIAQYNTTSGTWAFYFGDETGTNFALAQYDSVCVRVSKDVTFEMPI